MRIAARAHELYEQRGCLDGYHLRDWLEAEREILGASGRDGQIFRTHLTLLAGGLSAAFQCDPGRVFVRPGAPACRSSHGLFQLIDHS